MSKKRKRKSTKGKKVVVSIADLRKMIKGGQVKRLNKEQKRLLSRNLTKAEKRIIRNTVVRMQGRGIGDIVRSIIKVLGPIGKIIGPVILKEIVTPLIGKLGRKIGRKIGLLPQGAKGLRLAGQRIPFGSTRAKAKASPMIRRRKRRIAPQQKAKGLRLPGSKGGRGLFPAGGRVNKKKRSPKFGRTVTKGISSRFGPKRVVLVKKKFRTKF